MSSIDFEALGLSLNDSIWVQDDNGHSSWGKYMDGYDVSAQTFLFRIDRGPGITAIIHLPEVRDIER